MDYFQTSKAQSLDVDITAVPKFIRAPSTGDRAFFVENGNAHWIKNPPALLALGGDFKRIMMVDDNVFKVLNTMVEAIDIDNAGKYVTKQQASDLPEKKEIKKEPEFKEYKDEGVKQEEKKGFTSIVLPAYLLNFSLFHMTGNCIGSIREHTDKEKTPYEIILIINGNKVMEFEHLEDTYCDKIIVNKENMGGTHAINQGIRMSTGEYIVVFSNDILVYDHWLEDFQESLQYLDYVMSTPMYGMPFARGIEAGKLREKTLGKSIKESFHNNADGSLTAMRKSLYDEIGLPNADLYQYKTDVDFRLRMDKFGKKYAATNRVNIHHIIGATTINQTREEMREDESDLAFKKLWPKNV